MTRFREIQTLSDHQFRLADPVTLILGTVTIAQQLFPSIFGGNRKLMTDQDWMQVIPGNGYWSLQIRNYLKERVKYNTDVRFAYPFQSGSGQTEQGHISAFVNRNRLQICPEVPVDCFVQGGVNVPCQQCLSAFANILKSEGTGGGSQFPVNFAGFDLQKYLPYLLIGGIALILFNKPKRKSK